MTGQFEGDSPVLQQDVPLDGAAQLRVAVDGLTLSAVVVDGAFAVRLAGDLDFSTTRQRVTGPLLDVYRAQGARDIEVDLSAVTFLDSGGLSFLVRLRAAAIARGGTVTLRGRSPHSSRVLILSGVMQLFPATQPEPLPDPVG